MTLRLRTLAMLLRQGEPLAAGLERLAVTGGEPWKQASRRCAEGASVGACLKPLLPGPASSVLDSVGDGLPGALDRLADLLERSAQRSRDWKMVAAWPTLIVALTVGLLLLCQFALGQFIGMFQEVNLALPLPTRVVLAIVHIFQDPVALLLYGAPLAALFWTLFVLPSGRLRLPIIGSEIRTRESQSFCAWAGYLHQLGQTWPEAFRTAAAATHVPPIRRQLELAADALTRGDSLEHVSSRLTWFPSLSRWLIAQAGQAVEPGLALQDGARLLARDSDIQGSDALAVFESAAVVVLCLAVGFVILSVFLPLYQLIGNMG